MKLWRCETNRNNPVVFEDYTVIKETSCGYWLNPAEAGRKRWVSKTGHKRWAYPTKKEALLALKHRRERQISILSSQLEAAKSQLVLTDHMLDNNILEDLTFDKIPSSINSFILPFSF